MLRVGVTGGIGSGKSIVCKAFSVLGVPVYNSDLKARSIIENNKNVHRKLIAVFGKRIMKSSVPDRKLLASLVFTNRELLVELENIVHPEVKNDFENWVLSQKEFPYIIKESAILFETGIYKDLDYNILITAPEDIRVERVVERDGVTEENVRRRLANQWSDDKLLILADKVLVNDNKNAVLPVVLELHNIFFTGSLARTK